MGAQCGYAKSYQGVLERVEIERINILGAEGFFKSFLCQKRHFITQYKLSKRGVGYRHINPCLYGFVICR